MNATKILLIAAAVLVAVIIVSATFKLSSQGEDAFASGDAELVDTISDMSTGKYDIYDKSSETGEGVIGMITKVFNDETIEVLVCCKDGSNFVYNEINVGKSTATVISLDALTGMPTYDAVGKAFDSADNNGSGTATILGAPSAVMCSTGYNTTADVSITGYISKTATFTCYVQKDLNGSVRRLTFVQN